MAKFDLSQTQALADLFAVDREKRDDAWRQGFYTAVPDATLMAFDPQVSRGPDQFPYFALAIPDAGPVTPFCITHILDFLLDNGFGATVWRDSTRSGAPEWVFTYGDLLSYHLYGGFDTANREGRGPAKEVLQEDRQVLVAAPSEAYLPARARKVMGSFVRHFYHLADPKMALVVDPKLNPPQNLMINLTLAQYDGDERKLASALGYLRWFLPRHYAVMAMPDTWSDAAFASLG